MVHPGIGDKLITPWLRPNTFSEIEIFFKDEIKMGSKKMFLITTSSLHSSLNLTRAALDQLFKVSDFKNCPP